MREVRFYLDFVSPYSWLALMQAREFAAEHDVRWELRPVVYSKILDATGLSGPVESPAKRRYTFLDVVRCAGRAGLRCVGPPAHPFRSLAALRVACLSSDEPGALDLCVGLANAAWGEGRDLTDFDVLGDVVSAAGLAAGDLQGRVQDEKVKATLRQFTDAALQLGVFGVPTFVFRDELFWGHDRLPHLADRLSGVPAGPGATLDTILARPAGARRRGAPGSQDAASGGDATRRGD